LNDDIGRYKFAFLNIAFNGFSQCPALLLFLPEEVTSGKMLELIISNQILSLCALPASWPSQQKEDVGLGEKTEGICIFLYRARITCDAAQPIYNNKISPQEGLFIVIGRSQAS
jgi:hypothetical protein